VRIHNWQIQADWGHILMVTVIAAVSVWYFFDARQASHSIYNLIMIVPCVIAILVLYLATLVLEVRIHHIDENHSGGEQSLRGLLQPVAVRNGAMMVLLIVYIVLLEPLGFEIATFFFVGLSLLLQGERHYLRVLIFSLLFSFFATWMVSLLSLAPIPTTFI